MFTLVVPPAHAFAFLSLAHFYSPNNFGILQNGSVFTIVVPSYIYTCSLAPISHVTHPFTIYNWPYTLYELYMHFIPSLTYHPSLVVSCIAYGPTLDHFQASYIHKNVHTPQPFIKFRPSSFLSPILHLTASIFDQFMWRRVFNGLLAFWKLI